MSASVSEARRSGTPLNAALVAGLETLSLNQEIEFTRYVRVVLPVDGFVFWVKADLLSPSALLDAMALNEVTFDQQSLVTPAATFKAKGSLHYTTINQQNKADNSAKNAIVFTSEVPVGALDNEINPGQLFMGEFEGQLFSFSVRSSFYRQANLYHYTGDAVYPVMRSQVVTSLEDVQNLGPVVSNSLPFWLSLRAQTPEFPFLPTQNLTLYPSFLIPDNIRPPYGAVHIEPSRTEALQAFPRLTSDGSSSQLATDVVEVTMWGMRNDAAQDWLAYVLQVIGYEGDPVGLMSTPVLQDGKSTQVELSTLAQMKTVAFTVSYHQSRMRNLARKLIKSAFITTNFGEA